MGVAIEVKELDGRAKPVVGTPTGRAPMGVAMEVKELDSLPCGSSETGDAEKLIERFAEPYVAC